MSTTHTKILISSGLEKYQPIGIFLKLKIYLVLVKVQEYPKVKLMTTVIQVVSYMVNFIQNIKV